MDYDPQMKPRTSTPSLKNPGHRKLVLFIVGINAALMVALFAIFAVILFFGMWKHSPLEDAVLRESRSNRQILDLVKQNIFLLAQDSNEVRRILKLPQKAYDLFLPEEKIGKAGEEEEQKSVAFFRAVDRIVANEKATESKRRYKSFLSSKEVSNILQSRGWQLKENGEFAQRILSKGRTFFFIRFDPENAVFEFESYTGETYKTGTVDAGLEAFLLTQDKSVATHYARVYESYRLFASLSKNQDILRAMKKRGLIFRPMEERDDEYVLTISRDPEPIALSLVLSKKENVFVLGDRKFSNFDSFMHAVAEKIPELEIRTQEERELQKQKEALERFFLDDGFRAFLDSKGLRIANEIREDAEYYYYDLVQGDGTRVGSYGLQKFFAEVYLMDSDDVPIGSLKSLQDDDLQGNGKKKR